MLHDDKQEDKSERSAERCATSPSTIIDASFEKSFPPLPLKRKRTIAKESFPFGSNLSKMGADLRSSTPRLISSNGRRNKYVKEEIVMLQIKQLSDINYQSIISEIRRNINLETDIGINSVRIRKTNNGSTSSDSLVKKRLGKQTP